MEDKKDYEKEMDFYTLDEFKQFISKENDIKFKCLYETLYYCKQITCQSSRHKR